MTTTTETRRGAQRAMLFLRAAEREDAETRIRDGIEGLLGAETGGGERFYTDEEIRELILQELDEQIEERYEEGVR